MANLKIDIYCNDGSPLNITPPMIYGRGVGGAELSMMTWAETMAARGHQVRVYNNPDTAGTYDDVAYLPQDDFERDYKRDVLIVYRSPIESLKDVNLKDIRAGVKIHWSTDQYTIGDYAVDIVPFVDKVVCISPYHMRDYQLRLKEARLTGVWPTTNWEPPPLSDDSDFDEKITYIDLGVRLQDYPLEMEKVLNRFIFCSVPDRGLTIIRQIWPQIKEALPDATLVITSDYRLWGSHPGNHKHRLDLLGCDGIVFLGAIERHELAKHQAQAQIHLYPCLYEELFAISVAECQAVGAYPITPDIGALQTTNQWGTILPGDAMDPAWQKMYIDIVIATALDQDRLIAKAKEGIKLARVRFDWERICDEWERIIEGAENEKSRLD